MRRKVNLKTINNSFREGNYFFRREDDEQKKDRHLSIIIVEIDYQYAKK